MKAKLKITPTLRSISLGLLIGTALPFLHAAPAQEESAPPVSSLKELKTLNRQLIKMAKPSAGTTVSLVSKGGGGAGSGVIVSEDGLILTAAHVVDAMSDDIIVLFPDGSRKSAKPLGADFDRDAAMVQITEEGSYPYSKLGESEGLRRNDWCVALGHPGGFDPMRTPPVRLGRVLRLDDFIVSDCAVVGGDSGGPLFDVQGKVLGIHSNIGSTLSENRHVPISVYKAQWDALKSGERSGKRFAGQQQQMDPDRTVLGVQLSPEPPANGGVLLGGTMKGSPAEKAGLKAGDIILSVNGKETNSTAELAKIIGPFPAGKEVDIVFLRGEKQESVKIKLVRYGDMNRGDRPKPNAKQEKKPAEPKKKASPKKDAKTTGNPDALKKLLEDAIKNGAPLELGPKELEKLGGVEELTRQLKEIAKTMDPKDLMNFMRQQMSAEPDEFFLGTMNVLRPVVANAAKSTVVVLANGKQAALGTIITGDGQILTKDSETQKGKIAVAIGKDVLPATLLKRFPKRDLALFQIEADGLKPINWSPNKRPLRLGSLLTASGPTEEPLGIGLVSVLTRALADVGFLGIQTADAEDGVKVEQVVKDSPAGKAGLKIGDVILSLNGKPAGKAHELGNEVRQFRAGDEIEVKLRSGEKERTAKIKLAARQSAPDSGRFQRMNEMSGPLSDRLNGFPEALQHDIPLDPAFCGGPLLDLNGRCVGINVSRAGRVKTLAIPASDVLELLGTVDDEPAPAAKVAEKDDTTLSSKERAEVRKVLEELKKTIEDLEKRLEPSAR